MPELPDILLYRDALRRHVRGQRLNAVELPSPFLLRSVEVPIEKLVGQTLDEVDHIGKRLVFRFSGPLWAVFHLMIAGRFSWKKVGAKAPGRIGLAVFRFEDGTLLLREAGTKKRASLHLVDQEDALAEFDRGGADPLDIDALKFRDIGVQENHTLKRTLTDPRLYSGIGNAYSDEILHHAQLSPLLLSQKMTAEQWQRLHGSTQSVLRSWIERLAEQCGDAFPEKVTAFRPEMAVHGKYKEPCPVCETPVQRIRYAENETNYCPTCQTAGKLLADRSLSRLLKKDWPKTIEELENLKRSHR